MSNVSPWLRGQRKTELVELATAAGLTDFESLKKSELEIKLDEHLRKNEITLGKHSKFNPFYTRGHTSGSPVKRESAGTSSAAAPPTSDGESRAAPKPRGRRVTKVAEPDHEATDESSPDPSGRSNNTKSALATRTPARANLALARNVPLPPSPAVIADAVDRRTAVLRSKVSGAWDNAGLTERAEGWRDTLSSVTAIDLLVVLVEAWGLRGEVLPSRYAFTIPAVTLLLTPDWPVYLPDLFFLLTAAFWGPFTLWLSTSVLLPLVVAYFINLTLKHRATGSSTRGHAAASKSAHSFDPLTFNVAKALVAYLVYSQEVRFGGLVSDDSVERVAGALPAGATGIFIGAGIGAVASIYEAVLKK